MSAINAISANTHLKPILTFFETNKKLELKKGLNKITQSILGISLKEDEVFSLIYEEPKVIFLQTNFENPLKVSCFFTKETQNNQSTLIAGNEYSLRTPTLIKFEDLSVNKLIKIEVLSASADKEANNSCKVETCFFVEFNNCDAAAKEKDFVNADEILLIGRSSAAAQQSGSKLFASKALDETLINFDSEIKKLGEIKDLKDSNIVRYFDSGNIEKKIQGEIKITNKEFSDFKENLISLKTSSQTDFGLKSLMSDYVVDQDPSNKINSSSSSQGVVFNMNLNMNMNMNFSTNIYNQKENKNNPNPEINCEDNNLNSNLNLAKNDTEKNEISKKIVYNKELNALMNISRNKKNSQSTRSLIDLQNKDLISAYNLNNKKKNKKAKEDEQNLLEFCNDDNQIYNLKTNKSSNKRKSTFEIALLPNQRVTHIDDFMVIEEIELEENNFMTENNHLNLNFNFENQEEDFDTVFLDVDQNKDLTVYLKNDVNPLKDKMYRISADEFAEVKQLDDYRIKDVAKELFMRDGINHQINNYNKDLKKNECEKEHEIFKNGNLSLDKNFSNKNIIRINFSKHNYADEKNSHKIKPLLNIIENAKNKAADVISSKLINSPNISVNLEKTENPIKTNLKDKEANKNSQQTSIKTSNSNSSCNDKKPKYLKDLNMDAELIINLTKNNLKNNSNKEDRNSIIHMDNFIECSNIPSVSKDLNHLQDKKFNKKRGNSIDHISILNRTLMEDNIVCNNSQNDIQKNILKLDKILKIDEEVEEEEEKKQSDFLQQKRKRDFDTFNESNVNQSRMLMSDEIHVSNNAKNFKKISEKKTKKQLKNSIDELNSSAVLNNSDYLSHCKSNNLNPNYSSFTHSNDEFDSADSDGDSSYRNRRIRKRKKKNKAAAAANSQNKQNLNKSITSNLNLIEERSLQSKNAAATNNKHKFSKKKKKKQQQ